MKVLHFADAHIDMANYGRHDPQTGLPLRVLDFLKSLDTIVETAIAERVDLVLFAGDAYRDRTPAPTYQREWGRRIIRLSKAGIPTLLLVGNHDLSPALGRANAVQEFETLEIPHVRVLAEPQFLTSAELGVPVQVIAIPWVTRSMLAASLDLGTANPAEVLEVIEGNLVTQVGAWLDQVAPDLPVILTAHASVQGAVYGSERSVMLGADLVLPGELVKDPRLDYVALGHIHKPQDLNPNGHPPIIYPGSIERVDFGEAEDEKYFIVAEVERGRTRVDWRKLETIRPFVDRRITLTSPEDVTAQLKAGLPSPEAMAGAIVRLSVEYPREWDSLIDEASMRAHTAECFEFHLIKSPWIGSRLRLSPDQAVSSLSPLELLDQFWRTSHMDPAELDSLQKLAREILEGQDQEGL